MLIVQTNIVESCQPTNQSVEWTMWAFVVLLISEFVTFYIYHNYKEGVHLAKRVEKVGLIARRQTERQVLSGAE